MGLLGDAWNKAKRYGNPITGPINAGADIINYADKQIKGPAPTGNGTTPETEEAQRLGQQFNTLGEQAFQRGQQNTSDAINDRAPGVRQAEWLRKGLSGPGALESRYASALNGPDVAAQRERDLGARQINQQYGASGGGRSGAALQATANMDANIVAKNQARLDDLAGGAQSAQEGRYGRVFGAVNDVSKGVSDLRFNGGNLANAGAISGQAAGIQNGLDVLTQKGKNVADQNLAYAKKPGFMDYLQGGAAVYKTASGG